MYLRVYHRIFVYGCLNSNSKSHRLCVLTCADVISITLQYAVHDKPLALQLHLWFAHREADLQLQAILCRTEGSEWLKYLRLGSGHYCQTSNHTESHPESALAASTSKHYSPSLSAVALTSMTLSLYFLIVTRADVFSIQQKNSNST